MGLCCCWFGGIFIGLSQVTNFINRNRSETQDFLTFRFKVAAATTCLVEVDCSALAAASSDAADVEAAVELQDQPVNSPASTSVGSCPDGAAQTARCRR